MSLYTTTAINDTSIPEETRIEGGLALKMTPPRANRDGSNPEQLLGMAWATCLNATAQSLLKARKLTHQSRVRVDVSLHQEEGGNGYYFTADATLAVEGMDAAEVETLMRNVHERCPVSKLMAASANVHVHTEGY